MAKSDSSSLFLIETERHLLSSLIKYPESYGDIADFISNEDWSKVHQPFFEVIRFQLDQKPQGSVAPVILSDLLKKHNVSIDGITPYEYLQSMELMSFRTGETINFAKEVKKASVRRKLVKNCSDAIEELTKSQDKSAEELVAIVDNKLSNINVQLYQSDTENIFDSIIDVVEERGNNPIDSSQMGLMGPFETINNSLGSLSVSGAMTCIASRTGGGKSSIGFFYNVYLAEKYNLPVLHLDAAEMTVEQLQMRAICCLSNGRIPLWAVKSGEWRKNPEFFRIIRDELWPRVKKIKIYYKNVGQFRRQELISYIRRFYYNKVGRGNHLLINWDYIKGLEAAGKNNQEYQEIGYQVGDMKSLVTDEITASIWTAVQANRGGISTGKDSKSLEDNESSIGLSDRIIQMCSNAFFLRWKTPDELFSENNQFGNLVFKSLKERELLGKNYEDFLMPVQTPDGRYVKNYFNLQTKNFHYTDICDYRTMLGKLGKSRAKIDSKKKNTYELDV